MNEKSDRDMLEICGNCSRRYGQHYSEFCKVNYPSTSFKPTGYYAPLDYFRFEVLKAKLKLKEK